MSHTSLPVTIPYLISDWTFFLRCQQNKGASETQWFKKHTILVAKAPRDTQDPSSQLEEQVKFFYARFLHIAVPFWYQILALQRT